MMAKLMDFLNSFARSNALKVLESLNAHKVKDEVLCQLPFQPLHKKMKQIHAATQFHNQII